MSRLQIKSGAFPCSFVVNMLIKLKEVSSQRKTKERKKDLVPDFLFLFEISFTQSVRWPLPQNSKLENPYQVNGNHRGLTRYDTHISTGFTALLWMSVFATCFFDEQQP